MDTGYLSQQVTTIINQLHGLFDEIGLPSHERDSRESELFAALSDTLHNQLKLVAREKHDLTEEARRLVKAIRLMETALDDTRAPTDGPSPDPDLRITLPLRGCIQTLEEKHATLAKLHRERFEQVKKLAEALQSYASHLEPSFVAIELPPTSPGAKVPITFDMSPGYVSALDAEFTRVYEEYNRRLAAVQAVAEDVVLLWGELGTPQAQIDSAIVKNARSAPEQLGLHQDDLDRLAAKRAKLVDEKHSRELRVGELKMAVEGLWDRLGVDEAERKPFLASNRGCGLRTINEFEDELCRLNELKRQNLHLFVEDARLRLQELWDGLYFSEEEMLDFTPAFSDVYSDALLEAHEAEMARLEALREQRAPTLAMIDRYRSLVKDREDLAASSQDASRLLLKGQKGEKRDPTRLLREEKMRKRIAKELPKVEADLRSVLDSWEEEYGRPFLVHGRRYLDELDATSQRQPPPPRSKTPSIPPPRSKTPSVPPPTVRPRSAAAASAAGRANTLRGPPPPATSRTPTLARNPLAQSVMGPPSSASSLALGPSLGPASLRSPSRIPGRLPLSNLAQGTTSPERRPRLAHCRTESEGTLRTRMGPPRAMPQNIRDVFPPSTPCPVSHSDVDFDRSTSILRTSPDDYSDVASVRSGRTYQSSASGASRPASQLHHYAAAAARPSPRFDYPPAPAPAPAMSRQASNTSSVLTSASAVSGSENWETYTDASEDEAEEAAHYAKMRAKRLSPYDGASDAPSTVKRGMLRTVGVVEESGDAWSDVGETF